MFKSFYKSIFKLVFTSVILFLGIRYVSAFDVIETDDIFYNCNSSNKCVPLCIYGDNQAMIGYYYDTKEWEISFRFDQIQQNTGVSNAKVRYSKDKYIPKDDIYSGSIDDDKDFWKGSYTYGLLSEKFTCPLYLYVSDNHTELCLEDQSTHGDCETRKTIIGQKKFSNPIKPTYSFSAEYSNIAKSTYDELIFTQIDNDNVSDDKIKDKIKLLSEIDGIANGKNGIKFNESLSSKDNALLNCDYIKENASGDKMSEYMSKIAANGGREFFISNRLNPTLSKYADSSNSRNFTSFSDKSFYNYNTLYKILVLKDSPTGNSDDIEFRNVDLMTGAHESSQVSAQPSFRYLYDIFGVDVSVSINYIVSVCGDEGIIIDTPSTNDTIGIAKTTLGLTKYQDPIIDFKDNYDCSFLSEIADLISSAYFILELAGLALLIVLSVLDYVKVFLNDNADELKKANSNFIKRLIIAVILFLLPALVNFMLSIFKIEGVNSEHPLCVKMSNK